MQQHPPTEGRIAPMEEAMQPLEPAQPNSAKYLAAGIAVSVILHVTCTIILLGLPQGSSSPQSITYVDLNSVQAPAPLTPPSKKAALEPVAPKPAPVSKPEMVLPDKQAAAESPAPVEPAPEAKVEQEPPPVIDTTVEEQLTQTSLGLGLTKGYFKSLGSGETLRSGIREYYLGMLEGINQKWWLDPKLDKRRLTIVVNITIARNGEIVASQILNSSGDRIYDRAVLEAIKAASPLPPLPDDYEGYYFDAPVRLVPPLNLMSW